MSENTTMKWILIFTFAAVVSWAEPFLCVIKTQADNTPIAPTLASGRAPYDGVLDTYLVQTMIRDNPTTVIGLDTSRLDYRKSYTLEFKAQAGAKTVQFKIGFIKRTGLIVQLFGEMGKAFAYEFMESSANPPAVTIPHQNGWTSKISCMAN